MSDEEVLQLRTMESRLQGLMQHRDMVAGRVAEIEATAAGIEEVSKAKGEALFHVGGEAFMQARPSAEGKVIVMVGADVALEKTAAEAKELLQRRKAEAEQAMKRVQAEIDSLAKEMESMANDMASHAGHAHPHEKKK
jgi:prefoldin alpha subunit